MPPIPTETNTYIYVLFQFLVDQFAFHHKCARKQGTVGNSMKDSDNVTVVAFLCLLLQCLFKTKR